MKPDTKTSTKFPFQEELIALIKEELKLHTVYVISSFKEKRKQTIYLSPLKENNQEVFTYTLLIISYKSLSKRIGDFMSDLYNKMQKQCKVYTINYTLSNVKKRLDYGDNFLSQVIFHTPCIYKEDDSLEKFREFSKLAHQSVYNDILETWNNRMNRAEYLLTTISNIEPDEESIAMLSTMHYALEQICLGLLYVFWEFRPEHYSLSYMLHLCSHFTDLPQTIFTTETYGMHRLHYILCNAPHIMRFKSKKEFSIIDAEKAYNYCVRFHEEAKSVGEKQLKHLREFYCKQAV